MGKDAQTYISQSENRDGDSLTGTYSYVNPAGALITVNYEAGPMGFSQTLDQQDGFVEIKPQPVKVSSSSSSSASGSRVTSSGSGSRFSGATSTASNTGFSSTSSSSSSATSSFVAAQPVAVAAPPRARLAALPAPTGGVASTFGDGFSVKIDTPEFNIEY